MTILELRGVEASYGQGRVLQGVDLSMHQGECVALLGRNGMGKTTTIRTIMGQLPLLAGSISRFGDSRSHRPSHDIAASGIGLVPEGRQIFSNLSVQENLTAFHRPDQTGQAGWGAESVLALFPRLAERLDHAGSNLSGGEQQMLAIGRALMTNPRLLILDEATEGLAPIIRQQIWQCLAEIRKSGQSILVVDKNIRDLAVIADRFLILEKGQVVWQGEPQTLLDDKAIQHRYLGV